MSMYSSTPPPPVGKSDARKRSDRIAWIALIGTLVIVGGPFLYIAIMSTSLMRSTERNSDYRMEMVNLNLVMQQYIADSGGYLPPDMSHQGLRNSLSTYLTPSIDLFIDGSMPVEGNPHIAGMAMASIHGETTMMLYSPTPIKDSIQDYNLILWASGVTSRTSVERTDFFVRNGFRAPPSADK